MAIRAQLFGIANVDSAAVESTLAAYIHRCGGSYAVADGMVEDFDVIAVTGVLEHPTSVFVRWHDWWGVRDYLLATFATPFLTFHVYEHDFWSYELFVAGIRVDSFNPNPAFWNDAPDSEPWPWAGNPSVLCQHWPNIAPTRIENYYEPWGIEDTWDTPRKAYPDDHYRQGDALQVADFMRRLNLICPITATRQLEGMVYHLGIPAQ